MGSPLKNLNHLAKHMKHPCHINESGLAEVRIIIETAFAAGIPVLVASKAFSCLDIVKASGGISWKCGRSLKAVLDQVRGPDFQNKFRALYSLSGLAIMEQGLWYYFIAELATEFAANWTSLMYSQEGCKGPMSGTLTATAGPFDYEAGVEDGRVLFGGGGGNDCCAVGGQHITVLAGCNADVSFSNNVERCGNGQPLCSMQTQVIDETLGTTIDASNFTDGSATNNSNILMAQNLNGGILGKSYHVKVTTNGPDGTCAQLNKGQLTITSFGHSVKPVSVGCDRH